MRIVVDTNVLISGVFLVDSPGKFSVLSSMEK